MCQGVSLLSKSRFLRKSDKEQSSPQNKKETMSRKQQNKEFVEIELDPTDAAKAKVLCERKGLPFPSGLSFLVQEVVQPKWNDIKPKKSKKPTTVEHSVYRKSLAKNHRSANRKARFGR